MSTSRSSRSSAGASDASELQSMNHSGERELKKQAKLLQNLQARKASEALEGYGRLQAESEPSVPNVGLADNADADNDVSSKQQSRPAAETQAEYVKGKY